MRRITFARLTVLLLAAGALALSGCGGGDGNGVDQSLHDSVMDDRDTEKARADAAEALAATEKMRADDAEALAATEKMRADDAEGMSGEGQDAIDAAMQADMDTHARLRIIDALAEDAATTLNEPTTGRVTAVSTVMVSAHGHGFQCLSASGLHD